MLDKDLKDLGRMLKEARNQKGLTQMELSGLLGKKYNIACTWENGLGKFEVEELTEAMKILGIKKEELKGYNLDGKLVFKAKSRIDAEISDRVKKLREDGGYTKVEVAKQIGAIPSHYSRIEEGVSNPTLPQVRALSKFFKVSYEYLIDGKEMPKVANADLAKENARLKEALANIETDLAMYRKLAATNV